MKKITILIIFSTIYSINEKIDIQSSSIQELSTLPISTEKIISIKQYLDVQNIQSIYDLLYIENINIEDIHIIRSFIKIPYNDKDKKVYKYGHSRWIGTKGEEIPTNLVDYVKIFNVNDITYDQLNFIPNFSPIDVVAVLKQQKRGSIKGTFQLKNSPGISYYGYKNLLDWVSFDNKSIDKTRFRFETIIRSDSERITDEEDQELYYSGKSNPGMFYRLYLDTKNSTMGYLKYNNAGDPNGIYTDKFYIDFDNIKLNHSRIDHFIVGNFSANYGEGLVFASGDESRRRFTGSKWNKRKLGVSPDLDTAEELTLNGLAFQMSSKMNTPLILLTEILNKPISLTGLRFSYFISHDRRDAIINDDGSFTSLIFMRPRLGWGSSNENQERIYENMLDALTEQTSGANIRFSFNDQTNLGFTFYRSLYDRVLDPQIIRTVVGGGEDMNPDYDDGMIMIGGIEYPCEETDNPVLAEEFDSNDDGCFCCEGDNHEFLNIEFNDEDEYSGDAYYLNYPHSNPADNEINAMYSNATSVGDSWKSSRSVKGINFNTVINNLAINSEYAVMDTDTGNQTALLIKGFWKLADNLDVLLVHRNYDLGFDNPYQKSFSEYQRYKSSIFEDEWWLEDPIYTYLYQLNPQPQAEKGTYIESRYQFHEKFVLGLQWDSWLRKADAARYFRMVTKLEWRPLFNYRIYFRYKIQARGHFSIQHPSPYYLKEARVRFKLRLSNYDNLELFYAWNEATFSPRPRLVDSANPFIISMNVGDTGSPDESIGFSLQHSFSEDGIVMSGGSVYAHGFLWYFDPFDFSLFNNEFGLVNTWFAIGANPIDDTAISFKVSHTWITPSSRVIGGMTSEGNYVTDTYVLEEQLNYRLQIDYVFN